MNALPFILWRNGELVMGVPSNCRTAGTNLELPNLAASFKVAVFDDGNWHEENQEFIVSRLIAWGRPVHMLLIDALVNSIINNQLTPGIEGGEQPFLGSSLDLLTELVRESEPLCILFLTNRGLLTISPEVNNVWQLYEATDDLYLNTSEAVYSVMNHQKCRDSATIDLIRMIEGLGVLGANIPAIDYIHYDKYDWNPDANLADDLGKKKSQNDPTDDAV